ncbi:allophanate hydrolase subunit 1 [Pseudomonas lalucatii]|nr:allophanate hydrolase subunit 1 [Pseudomonas lalucatii]
MTTRAPVLRLEVAGIDSLILRLFDRIEESNMPWLLAASQRLRGVFGAALIDLVPSYTTLLLHYDMERVCASQVRELITQAFADLQPADTTGGRCHVLPTWYDRSVGPELALLARRGSLSETEVIRRHSSHEYKVFALGFAPGFAFMGLVEEALATPRLSTPRKRIAPGSVGIAERQTAVYPVVSPGGWNLLGRSPAVLFGQAIDGYSLLQPGDRVRFEPIDRAEFIRLGGDDSPLETTP